MATDPAALDRRLPNVDWSTLPDGALRDDVRVASGTLARVGLGPTDAGRRVVLVPGATGSKEDFLRLMPLLAAAGHRVESFDLAGQYQSAGAGPENLTPPGNRYTLSLFVDDLVAVLEQGDAPAHVLGYSFAGVVAAVAALRRPDLVATLTLLGMPPVSGRALRGMRVVGPLAGRASGRVAAAVLIQGIRWNLEGGTPALRRFIRARLRRTRLRSVSDIMTVMTDLPDLSARLRAAPQPILVAAGSHDLWPVRRHRDFAAACGARLAVYRAGHAPSESAPHQLAADMLRLFALTDRAG